MKIMVTGSEGFIGKNLVANLHTIRTGKNKTRPDIRIDEIYEVNRTTSSEELDHYCADVDFIFHLAGVNRVNHEEEYSEGNIVSLKNLLDSLWRQGNKCKIMFSSSVQALLLAKHTNSAYGQSKRECEKLLMEYHKRTGAEIFIYRFPNIFGKWCRPNYNSAVATFCDAVANNRDYIVNDPETKIELLYIDDLLEEMYDCLEGRPHYCNYMGMDLIPDTCSEFCFVPKIYHIKLGSIIDLLSAFKRQPQTLVIPNIPEDSFEKKLYSTYLSYLSPKDFKYALKMNENEAGSFTELLRSVGDGQFSVNVSHPGVVKGQHWHNSKWEIFVVVSGKAKIQLRKYGDDKIYEYQVSGKKLEALFMIPGYIHSLINISEDEDLVTIIWANEHFNQEKPDTFREYI